MNVRRSPTVFDSFNYAFEGIIHVLRTQRNMRIHFAVAFVVLVAALIVNVTKLELIALLISITFVLIAEMINTGIEAAIDIATTSFDPMAKLAKDIAAGAVLIATVNAVAVGYLVFAGKVADRSSNLLDRLRDAPAELTLVALVLTVIIVIATKAYTGRGTPLRGGLPSGHAALAFAGWMAVTYVAGGDERFVVSSIALVMAFLVAQTRVESGVHSALEVAYGAARGSARRTRRLPGVLVSGELVERGGRRSREQRVRAVLELPRRRRRAHDRRPRVHRRRTSRTRPTRSTQCAEKTAIGAAATAGYRPGDLAAIGDHAPRRAAAAASGSTSGASPRSRYRRDDGSIATATAAELLPDTWELPPNEVGLRGRRRPPERRQVDARQRARRARRSRSSPTSRTRRGTRSAACYTTRRRAARARRPAGLAEADRHADGADAGPRRRDDGERRRRGHARRQRARADRRGRPVRRAARVLARRAGDHRRQQGRPAEGRAHRVADEAGRDARRLPRACIR